MKKNNLRVNQTRRSKIAGLALAAILSIFPVSQTLGTEHEVGIGKRYATLEVLRSSKVISDGDEIVVYDNDTSVLAPFRANYQFPDGIVTLRPGSSVTTVLDIYGANLKTDQSLFLVQQNGVFSIESGLNLTQFRNKQNGGAIEVLNSGTLNILGASFKENMSDKNGGVLYSETGKVNINGATFEDNYATQEGGVGYVKYGYLTVNDSVFEYNSAAGGGSLVVDETVTAVVSGSSFVANSSTTGGGAVVLRNAALALTDTDFFGNQAIGQGGAMLIKGRSTLTLNTGAGFTSNWGDNIADSAGGRESNSIFFELTSESQHLTQVLNVTGDGRLNMDDPMKAIQTLTAGNGNSRGTIQINKRDAGTWSLGGSNVFRTDDAVLPGTRLLTTEFVVHGGVLDLQDSAEINIDRGRFVLKNGARIQANGDNVITVGQSGSSDKAIVLESGSGIVTDMLGGVSSGNLLSFAGDVASLGTGTFNVEVRNVDGDGTYTLINAVGARFQNAHVNVLFDGEEWDPDLSAANDRIGTRAVTVNMNDIVLDVSGMDDRRDVTWNGQGADPGDSLWSQWNGNWRNSSNSLTGFLNGDLSATFGSDATLNKDIVVDANGVTVGDIYMSGDYTFSGGSVRTESFDNGSGSDTWGVLTFYENGSLTLAGGDANNWNTSILLNGATDVEASLVAAAGETVRFTGNRDFAAPLGSDGLHVGILVSDPFQANQNIFNIGRDETGGAANGTIIFESIDGVAVAGVSFGEEATGTVRILGGETIFRDINNRNTFGVNGSAVAAANFEINGGDVLFENNRTTGLGGAVYVQENASLHAVAGSAGGNIVFRNNFQNRTDPNAIYLAGLSGRNSFLDLTADAGRSIEFFDPIATANPVAGESFHVSVSGGGAVRFDTHHSDVRATTDVHGTMQLTNGARYGAESGNPEFNLHTDATLLSDAKGNTVHAEAINFAAGSTIRIDLDGREILRTPALTLMAGAFDLPVDTNDATQKLIVDVVNSVENGRYLLVSAEGAGFSEDNTVGTIDGDDPAATSVNDRMGSRVFEITSDQISLTLAGFDINRTVIWSGDENDAWSMADANWYNNSTSSRYFLNGDTVVFSDSAREHDITVATSGVSVGNMTVRSGDYSFTGGSITGTGKLEKQGTGTLTLNQQNTFTDGAEVTAGSLAGGFGNQAVIIGDLTMYNRTSLNVGDGGAGQFRVDGNIAFNAGSYLYLDLGNTAATSDLLSASGSINFLADMEGTTTIVLAANGVAEDAAAYDGEIVRAEGGLQLDGQTISDGTRSANGDGVTIQRGQNKIKITSDSSLELQSAEIADSGRGLSVSAVGTGPVTPQPPSLRITWNHRRLMSSLQGAPTFTFGNSLLAQASILPDSEKGYFLEQALHTINSAGTRASFRNAENLRSILHYRLDNQFDVPASEYKGLLNNGLLGNRRGLFRGQRYCPNGAPVLWLQNYGDFLHQGRDTTQGYQSDSYGIALGFDHWVDSNLVLGMAFGGGFSSLKTSDRSQWGNVDSFIFSMYGSYTTSDRIRLTGSVGYVYSDYDLYRTPAGVPVSSSHKGDMGYAAFEISKKFRGDWTDITPFASMDFVYLDEESYDETDANGRRIAEVDGNHNDSVLMKLGARFGRTRINRFGWVATPSIWGGWIHDFGGGNFHTVATYEGAVPYNVKGASMNRDRIGVGLNYNAKVNQHFSFFGGYNAEYASRFSVHTIQAGLTLEF